MRSSMQSPRSGMVLSQAAARRTRLAAVEAAIRNAASSTGAGRPGTAPTFPLKHDVLVEVLSHLKPNEVACLARVCRAFRDAADDEMYWQRWCQRRGYDQAELPPGVRSWKKVYAHLWRYRRSALPRDPLHSVVGFAQHRFASLDFSPDARWLALACSDHIVRLVPVDDDESDSTNHSTADQMCVCSLEGHRSEVVGVAFGPARSALLASIERDGSPRLWNTTRRQCVSALRPPDPARRTEQLAFAPRGGAVAVGTGDGALWVWDAHTQALRASRTARLGRITALAYSTTGRLLASAGADAAVRLWTTDSYAQCAELRGTLPGPYPVAVGFSPDGQLLASMYSDRSVRLWDIGLRACLLTLPDAFDSTDSGTGAGADLSDGGGGGGGAAAAAPARAVSDRGAVCYSPDGRLVAAVAADESLQCWDVTTLSAPRVAVALEGGSWMRARYVAAQFAPHGRCFAFVADSYCVQMFGECVAGDERCHGAGRT